MHAWAEVCHLLQSSKSPLKGFLRLQYWLKNHWPDQAFFKHSPHTNCISNSVSGSNHLVRLQTWKKAMGWCTVLLFCAKTILKESRKFELARLKKKKKKKNISKTFRIRRLATFWFGTFAMLFSATGCVVRHENTWRWTAGCYNAL